MEIESGIKFIDNARLGTPDSKDAIVPDYLANNKAKIIIIYL